MRTLNQNANSAAKSRDGNAQYALSPDVGRNVRFNALSSVRAVPKSQEESTGFSGGRVISSRACEGPGDQIRSTRRRHIDKAYHSDKKADSSRCC